VSGALFGAAGTVGASTDIARYAAHAGAGCVSAAIQGGNCANGAASAVFGKYATNNIEIENFIGRGVAAAIAGGVGSVIGGGTFANGAKTAVFGYLFNECAHTRRCSDWMYTGDNRRVLAVESGVVTDAGWQDPNNPNAGYGYRIKVTSIDGQQAWIYAHMDPNAAVYPDLLVRRGDFIGNYASPANGNVTGPHLHLEARDSSGQPILNQGGVYPIPGGRKTSDINLKRTIRTNNGWQSRPHNGTDWVGGTQ
jgi:murein DD-endopeptidase MepM/ murein hydrolase activator NlpD